MSLFPGWACEVPEAVGARRLNRLAQTPVSRLQVPAWSPRHPSVICGSGDSEHRVRNAPGPAATLRTYRKWAVIHVISHFNGPQHRRRDEESFLRQRRINSSFSGFFLFEVNELGDSHAEPGEQPKGCQGRTVLKLVIGLHESFWNFSFSTVSANMQE